MGACELPVAGTPTLTRFFRALPLPAACCADAHASRREAYAVLQSVLPESRARRYTLVRSNRLPDLSALRTTKTAWDPPPGDTAMGGFLRHTLILTSVARALRYMSRAEVASLVWLRNRALAYEAAVARNESTHQRDCEECAAFLVASVGPWLYRPGGTMAHRLAEEACRAVEARIGKVREEDATAASPV